jgi:hypothetical protein
MTDDDDKLAKCNPVWFGKEEIENLLPNFGGFCEHADNIYWISAGP